MGDEANRLAALLNVSLPANPGKPKPWTPPSESDSTPPPASTDDEPAEETAGEQAGEPGAEQVESSAEDAGASTTELPPWDPTAVSEAVTRTIEAAERQRAQLEQAMADARRKTYEAESADGDVRVTVDGRPRVAAIHIDARALRGDGAAQLGQTIVEAANAAVRAAAEGTNETVLARLDPSLRAAVQSGLADLGAEER